MDKKSILPSIILYSFVALLFVGIAVGINMIDKKKKEERKNAVTEQLINLGVDEDKALEMTEEEADKVISEYIQSNTNTGYTFDINNKEYTDTSKTLTNILGYISERRWQDVINTVEPIKDKYNFTTPLNQHIITAYKDSLLLVNSASWTVEDYNAYFFGANNKECFLMTLLSTPGTNLLSHYIDETGLFPYYTDSTFLESVYYDLEKVDDVNKLKEAKYFYKIENYYENYNSIAEIEVSGRTSGQYITATCYLGSQNNYLTKVLGCYNSNTDKLFTVAEWYSLTK